ncbi:KIR-like protein [Plasmodium coatneyi]|uniref:KIR-like protein n=1 Tax=Plasmodium coatneyi TaxID=208452 RepID=A0A1B1DVR4_9APIC|nr:KIR-like protein [Plasmodium coatneyi]ANQ06687.1 KIR-like protein [Plasmodium coatneyi]
MSSDQHLSELPSWINFYNEFEKGTTEECGSGSTSGSVDKIGQKVNIVLNTFRGGEFPIIKDYLNGIIKGVCYVDDMYKENKDPFNNKRCWFLYFWIGHKLYKHPIEAQIKSNLNAICTYIKQEYAKHGCNLICTHNLEKEPFTNRKTLFEFLYDYTALRTLLWNIKSVDVDKCKKYLDGARAAYEAVKRNCTTPISDSYCTQFWNEHKDAIDKELTDLKNAQENIAQREQLAERKAQSISSQLSNATDQANKASSLSSAFGTIAAIELPAILLLLYKYKPWSSWFGKHSSGNGRSERTNRRRRSAGPDFDTLTEASTVDFTTSSETGSIIDDSTVRPVAYIGQPKGRNNNAGRHGMVGYQNM